MRPRLLASAAILVALAGCAGPSNPSPETGPANGPSHPEDDARQAPQEDRLHFRGTLEASQPSANHTFRAEQGMRIDASLQWQGLFYDRVTLALLDPQGDPMPATNVRGGQTSGGGTSQAVYHAEQSGTYTSRLALDPPGTRADYELGLDLEAAR